MSSPTVDSEFRTEIVLLSFIVAVAERELHQYFSEKCVVRNLVMAFSVIKTEAELIHIFFSCWNSNERIDVARAPTFGHDFPLFRFAFRAYCISLTSIRPPHHLPCSSSSTMCVEICKWMDDGNGGVTTRCQLQHQQKRTQKQERERKKSTNNQLK